MRRSRYNIELQIPVPYLLFFSSFRLLCMLLYDVQVQYDALDFSGIRSSLPPLAFRTDVTER